MPCPQCKEPLQKVPPSKWLNEDQYATVKAGDWFCTACPSNNRGAVPLCYWWDSEVQSRTEPPPVLVPRVLAEEAMRIATTASMEPMPDYYRKHLKGFIAQLTKLLGKEK